MHILTASATMVGVCLTVIGLIRISEKLRNLASVGDELLATDAGAFLVSCLLAYVALRSRSKKRQYAVERIADIIFLVGLCVMAIVCALIAYEMV